MKSRLILIAIIVFTTCSLSNSFGQSQRRINRVMNTNYKKKVKELEKADWIISGSSKTLEAAILEHEQKMKSDPNNDEKIVTVSMCKSMNVCRQTALNNAINEYAQNASSIVKGRIVSEFMNNASSDEPTEEFDRIIAAYERLVQTEIKGELKYSLSLEKTNGNGKTFQSWYIINEEKAHNARLKAMKLALSESKLSIEIANKISGFVNEGIQQSTEESEENQ